LTEGRGPWRKVTSEKEKKRKKIMQRAFVGKVPLMEGKRNLKEEKTL
jgi:hypothetical protein